MNTLVVIKLNWPDALDVEYLLAELHWICSYKKQILYYTDSQAKQTILMVSRSRVKISAELGEKNFCLGS